MGGDIVFLRTYAREVRESSDGHTGTFPTPVGWYFERPEVCIGSDSGCLEVHACKRTTVVLTMELEAPWCWSVKPKDVRLSEGIVERSSWRSMKDESGMWDSIGK